MNNSEKKDSKKKIIIIVVIAIIAIVTAICVLIFTLPKEKGINEATGSGLMEPDVTKETSNKEEEAKTEAESKKDSTIGKDAKTDDKTDNKTDNKQNGTSGQDTGSTNNTQQGQNNTNTNKPSGNNGNTSGGNTSGSGTGGNTQPSHTHSWKEVYRTVNHPAVTEQVWVEDQAAWDEPQYAYHTVCNCGFDFTAAGYSNGQIADHNDMHLLAGESDQYGTLQVQVGTIHHDAVGHYETKTVTAAWSEQMLDHYECSCGATK